MLRSCIIGPHKSLNAMRIKGVYCIDAENINEAEDKLSGLIHERVASVYIAEDFYSEICVYISKNYSAHRHRIKRFPSALSGDIGAVRELIMRGV